MPIVWIIGAILVGGGVGVGAYEAGKGTGDGAKASGQGFGDALRMALPIMAVGYAVYLYQKGAR